MCICMQILSAYLMSPDSKRDRESNREATRSDSDPAGPSVDNRLLHEMLLLAFIQADGLPRLCALLEHDWHQVLATHSPPSACISDQTAASHSPEAPQSSCPFGTSGPSPTVCIYNANYELVHQLVAQCCLLVTFVLTGCSPVEPVQVTRRLSSAYAAHGDGSRFASAICAVCRKRAPCDAFDKEPLKRLVCTLLQLAWRAAVKRTVIAGQQRDSPKKSGAEVGTGTGTGPGTGIASASESETEWPTQVGQSPSRPAKHLHLAPFAPLNVRCAANDSAHMTAPASDAAPDTAHVNQTSPSAPSSCVHFRGSDPNAATNSNLLEQESILVPYCSWLYSIEHLTATIALNCVSLLVHLLYAHPSFLRMPSNWPWHIGCFHNSLPFAPPILV